MRRGHHRWRGRAGHAPLAAPYSDENLREARPGYREERHGRLTGDRPGEQRLAGSRRADHEDARGTTAPTLAYRSRVRGKSTTSLISDFAPSSPATSANVVDGRSSSKTLARDRPALALKRRCRWPDTCSRQASDAPCGSCRQRVHGRHAEQIRTRAAPRALVPAREPWM